MENQIKPLWKDVHSSHVQKVFHLKGILYVTFKNNSVYEYFPVTKNEYEKLINAQSVGAHFHSKIVKNKNIKHRISKINKQ